MVDGRVVVVEGRVVVEAGVVVVLLLDPVLGAAVVADVDDDGRVVAVDPDVLLDGAAVDAVEPVVPAGVVAAVDDS